jgi:hypothetical protein
MALDPHDSFLYLSARMGMPGRPATWYAARGQEIPERELPGRLWLGMRPEAKRDVLRAIAAPSPPADWWIKLICGV